MADGGGEGGSMGRAAPTPELNIVNVVNDRSVHLAKRLTGA
jgi:hypothetical protein